MIITLLLFITAINSQEYDVFGIPEIYDSQLNFTNWNSMHWNNGNSREVFWSNYDLDDPTGLSQKRGSGTFVIDGNGILEMGGSQPRIYINGNFINTETTVYYRRTGTDGANWGGLIIGSRSTPNGHSSSNRNATTYYERLRHDGKIDFEKELTHSNTEYWWDNQIHEHGRLYDDGIPSDQWIGMKFIVFTPSNNPDIAKLELYIDKVSNGDSIYDINNWEKLGEVVDEGNFPVDIQSGYNVDPRMVITEGGGVTFIRNTGASKAEYKWFSIREIIPPAIYMQSYNIYYN